MNHAIHIESLRDLKASCSCGRWHFTAPTFDRDKDSDLRNRAKAAFALHDPATQDLRSFPPEGEAMAQAAAIEAGHGDPETRERYDSWTALCADKQIAF